ncbi:conserved hypothetical protein [Leishmania infantum JPCM5]|uniref:Uncharacterized protein n=2 Tax=Leishmania infantum TaxID=5671 RepID=A4IB96_LEIIN|nr:conserved hypothetical protein [Leishmania infantum JPCM5]CAC9544442.1 hypothetical_protein_-_conserved [Leishmania infantum]CAM72112.1 conserved hypothetical protein [Leishmania infantum JPCM5]SUZ46027.1 hypothetical_protein_-_conserved [Leishmania infantum]|eukprot:XP_001469015.1 conserved hypothetical protein [Leishmania infantum JPCM5]
MLRRSSVVLARFQPYSMAVQTRFKWRHKETDRWRRLMDATCFQVDWLGQTAGPNFAQYSGHWTHVITCAHVITPWDYPNYYPPQGPTRFVSHITLADTMTQIRLVSMQGNAVYKHFTSNQHVFVHSNPRLDLCVLHPEQNLKRSGEMKMMWMQNEGYILRPRLEINETLKVGDHVWVYGMSAHESLFDEEKGPEPLMIPTGVRARVHTVTREHFFLDTTALEDNPDRGRIQMGMCGSVVMRNGKCVGMLTATVHEESDCKELAGTAMCTYSSDIFEFLLEVEKQMKNPVARQSQEETRFEQRRRAEGGVTKEYKHWELDESRTARHIPVPVSLWHMEERWVTEEDYMNSAVFGRSGAFNQETQESALGYDMNTAKTNGDRPGDIDSFMSTTTTGKPVMQGERKDYSPTGVYANVEEFKNKDVWDYNVSSEMRSLFNETVDSKDAESLNMMRKSLENIRAQRAMEKMKETVMNRTEWGFDPLKSCGHYGGSADAGAANFSPEYASAHKGGGDAYSYAQAAQQAAREQPEDRASPASSPPLSPPPPNESVIDRKKRERREAEAKYQKELRRRHGQRAVPFGDEDLGGFWERH